MVSFLYTPAAAYLHHMEPIWHTRFKSLHAHFETLITFQHIASSMSARGTAVQWAACNCPAFGIMLALTFCDSLPPTP